MDLSLKCPQVLMFPSKPYTGKIDLGLVDEDPLAFISDASEYVLASLEFIAQRRSVRLVNGTNIKAMLQAAHLGLEACLCVVCEEVIGCVGNCQSHESQDRMQLTYCTTTINRYLYRFYLKPTTCPCHCSFGVGMNYM